MLSLLLTPRDPTELKSLFKNMKDKTSDFQDYKSNESLLKPRKALTRFYK